MNMNKGQSAIEIVLYLGLVILIMPVIAALTFFSVDVRVRGQEVNVVVAEGERLAQVLSQTIRNAKGINSPLLGESNTQLSLKMADSARDPTIFSLSNGAITIKEGVGQAISLISSQVTASNLIFSNKSQAGTPGTIKAQFTLSAANLTKNFYVSASLRQK